MTQITEVEDFQEIGAFRQEQLAHYWPHIANALARVPHIWENHHTLESLHNDAIEGRIQVWGVGSKSRWDMILFTDVWKEANTGIATMRIFLAVGKGIDDYLDLIDAQLDRFAAKVGCDFVEIIGRDGWARLLKKIGFRQEAVILRRRVQKGLH